MKSLLPKFISTIFLICISTTCYAIEVVRANFEFQGVNHLIDISLFDNLLDNLFDNEGPSTVDNFLSYVDDGSYNKLLINRSVPGFVIQAGAYTYDPLVGDGSFSYDGNLNFNGGLQLVPNNGPIINEFKLLNLRGTIAMAKVRGDVDSASNQWFINLADNANLDSDNGGFTVFGKVLGNGMDSIDLISAITTYDISSEIDINGSFLSIPLVDFTISSIINEISNNNLVIIDSFERLFKITDDINFGDAVAGTTIQQDIIIQNNNFRELQIGSIDTSSVTEPFAIITNPCQDKTLQSAEQCIIKVEFSPTSSDYFADSFNIQILTYGYTFPVTLKTPAPKIAASLDTIEFGIQPIYDPTQNPEQSVITINNNGDRALNISSITFNTQFTGEFQLIDNCTTANINNNFTPGKIPADGYCILVLNFKPTDLYEKSGIISIISDDPINSQLDIQVTGGASSDNDGINNTIEDAAPNNGDGNNDEIPDRLQDNVVSFPNTNNTYTTLITDENTLFTNVKPVQLSTIKELPDATSLENGAFTFELSGIPAGSIAEFGLILPSSNTLTNIYSFGPTSNDSTPHWYTLEINTTPGVIMIGDASLLNSSGYSVNRNLTKIRILDGGDGDSDQQVNGKILFVGGPEISIQSSSSSGALLWMLFFIPMTIMIYRK